MFEHNTIHNCKTNTKNISVRTEISLFGSRTALKYTNIKCKSNISMDEVNALLCVFEIQMRKTKINTNDMEWNKFSLLNYCLQRLLLSKTENLK